MSILGSVHRYFKSNVKKFVSLFLQFDFSCNNILQKIFYILGLFLILKAENEHLWLRKSSFNTSN